MDSRDRLLDVIGLAYQAARDPVLWPRALKGLADAVGGSGALIGIVDTHRRETASIDSGLLNDARRSAYKSIYFHINPRSRYAAKAEPGVIFHDRAVGDDRTLERNAYYAEFLRQSGNRYFIAANLENDGTRRVNLTVQRQRHAGHVQRREIALFHKALPHFRAAFALARELGGLREQERMHASAPPGAAATVLVDAQGTVLQLSAGAEETLAEAGFFDPAARAIAPLANGAAVLRAIADCARLADGSIEAPPPAPIEWRGPASRWRVHAAPYVAGDLIWLRRPAALLALVPLTPRALETETDALTALFGLTAAERSLAMALVHGASLKDFAAMRGVSINTARSQLAQLRIKTGVRTQAQIVRRILLETQG